MWTVLGLLFLGTIAGFLISKVRAVHKTADIFVRFTIYLLLFFMGITVGMNPEIINNIGVIGLHSFFIAAFSILGSVIFAKIIFNLFFKQNEK